MEGAGHHFFAGAGFAEDQHIGAGCRQGADLLAQAQHLRRMPDQARAQLLAITEGQAQAAVIQHQAAQGQRAAHTVEQGITGERFFEEVIGPGAHGLHRQRHIAVAGYQQHRQVRVLAVQFSQQLQAVHAGHADIADHHARPIAGQARREARGFAQSQDFQPGQVRVWHRA